MTNEIKNEEQTIVVSNQPSDEPENLKKQNEEYLNNWKRERADFINYKKDEAKRLEEFAKFANEDLVLETIEILDDLELAVKELKDMGLEQIIKKIDDLFKKYGVERIDVSGKFNPGLHEAVETEKEGTKMVEVRAGYTMHGQVI